MEVLYLVSIILGISIQNIVKKPYADKTNGKGVYFFGAVTAAVAMLFFLVSALVMKGGLEWEMGVMPYSVGFAVAYGVGTVFTVVAISCGPLSLTSLIIAFSLMLPALYGLVFLGEDISYGLIPGLILLVISLVLINKRGKNEKFSLKWAISVFLAFMGNGLCSIVQKMQQFKYDGAYKDELMIVALAIVTVFIGIMSVITERKAMKFYVKCGWHLGSICGVFNGMVNLFVMILSSLMNVSIMFPLISAGGIIVTYIVSRVFYKEQLTRLQFVGFILGMCSVVLLNI